MHMVGLFAESIMMKDCACLLQILAEDLSQVVSVQGPGSHFGELGFLFGAPRMSTVRAATHCQLVMLNKTSVDKVLEHFPLIAK